MREILEDVIWWMKPSAHKLEEWAAQNNYKIIECERRPFRRGPFTWQGSIGGEVYRILAQDQEGNRRGGWVEIGGMGDFFSPINVRWNPVSAGDKEIP